MRELKFSLSWGSDFTGHLCIIRLPGCKQYRSSHHFTKRRSHRHDSADDYQRTRGAMKSQYIYCNGYVLVRLSEHTRFYDGRPGQKRVDSIRFDFSHHRRTMRRRFRSLHIPSRRLVMRRERNRNERTLTGGRNERIFKFQNGRLFRG